MKKLLGLIMVFVCIATTVGCSKKDYGVFTKEGYDMLTDTARLEVIDIYNNETKRIELIRNGNYEEAIALGIKSIPSTANGGIIAAQIYDATINCTDKNIDLEYAFDLKGDAITNLLEYFTRESVEELQLGRIEITNMKKYLDDLE